VPPLSAWKLCAPQVILPHKHVHLIGVDGPRRKRIRLEDQNRDQWHLKRRFAETTGAILYANFGAGLIMLVGTEPLYLSRAGQWRYSPVSQDVGWTD
jgi:hypothetical protein